MGAENKLNTAKINTGEKNALIAEDNGSPNSKTNSRTPISKRKKALITCLCIVATFILLFVLWYLYEYTQNRWDVKEISIVSEYGRPLSITLSNLVDTEKYPNVTDGNTSFYITLNESDTNSEENVNLKNVEEKLLLDIGNYPIHIIHKAEYNLFSLTVFSFEEYKTMELIIKDTEAPVFSENCPSKIFAVQNTEIKNLNKIFSADDMTDVTFTIDEDSYDLTSVGEYPVKLVATDKSGNKTYLDIILKIVKSDDIDTSKTVTLINSEHSLPDDWSVNLKRIYSGQYADSRAYKSLMQMLSDCRKAGYSPIVCSSYRSHSRQETLFENKINSYIDKGYSKKDAKRLAATWVAVPGSSEHESGLAFDIVSKEYQTLDEKQAKTDCQKWLMKHCTDYGFILRYSKVKTEITGINYEPWHYRYVGKKAAKFMSENNLCLEEYYLYFCE